MMNSRGILSTLAGLLGVFVGGFAVGRLATHVEPPLSPGSVPQAHRNTADEFLQEATTLASEPQPDSQRRCDLLRTIALERQRSEPSCAHALWKAINEPTKSSAPEGTSNVRALAELVRFEDAIDEGLLRSDSIADFDEAWHVRREVENAISQRRQALVEHLKSTMPISPNAKTAQDCDAAKKALDDFAGFLERENQSLIILVATMRTDGPDMDLTSILKSESMLLGSVQSAVQSEEQCVRSLGIQIRGGGGPLDPGESGKDETCATGQCARHRQSLADLDRALAKIDLESWRQLRQIAAGRNAKVEDGQTGPGSSETPLVAISKSIAGSQSELRQLQLVAYNLWALREIEAAETVDGWDGRLARIDQSVLEPAVAALYGSVYARRMEAVKDPEQRSRYVRRLLSSERVPLTSF